MIRTFVSTVQLRPAFRSFGFFLFLFALLGVACFRDTNRDLKLYNEKYEAADRFELQKDSDSAEACLREAQQIAKDGHLTDLLILTTLRLGDSRMSSDPKEAEQLYKEAEQICNQNSCDLLGSVYDHLFLLYVFKTREIDKALEIFSNAMRDLEKPGDAQKARKRLESYVEQLQGAGFTEQAATLRARVYHVSSD